MSRSPRLLAGWLPLALLAPLALSLLSCRSTSPTTATPSSVGMSEDRLEAVRDQLETLVEDGKIAGGVALVARRGQVVRLDAVGTADVENRLPMTPDTLFRICSMTKPITSVGVLMLVEDGKISLDDRISTHIPSLRDMQVAVPVEQDGVALWRLEPARREITIRDLLTHTTGVTYRFWGHDHFTGLYEEAGVSDGLAETAGTMADNVARLAKVPLMFHPGERWEYGLNTDILGHLIEVVSGQTLDAFLRERVFAPLGMRDTGFRVPPEKATRLAAVYRPHGEEQTIERLPAGEVRTGAAVHSASYPLDRDSQFFSGGAGLVSTAPDYFRFLQMLLDGGRAGETRLLRAETVAEMTKDHLGDLEIAFDTHGDGFGLGVGVVTPRAADRGLGSVGTFSWGGFYHTYFWVDPQEELIGIVLTQLYPWDHLSLWSDFRTSVYEALDEEPPEGTATSWAPVVPEAAADPEIARPLSFACR